MHFTIFVFHREKYTGVNAGRSGRDKRGADAGCVGKINKNNCVADYKMQM